MKKSNKFLTAIVIALALWVILILFRWVFFNVAHGDDVIDGMAGFREAVKVAMEEGSESGVFYIKNIDTKEINKINTYVDSAYGSVSSYSVLLSSGEYLAIKLYIERSENYYVIRKILYDEDIPEDQTRAQEIYEVCVTFYDTYITDSMTDYEKELAVHDYLEENCAYGFPSSPDDDQDAYTIYGTLVIGSAVCDGYAQSFFLLMTGLGIDCDIVVGEANGELHAWNQVKLGGEWYNVDITWDDAVPDMGSYLKHTYLNVTDAAMAASHTWTEEYYHQCTETRYNYYIRNVATFDDYESFEANVAKLWDGNGVIECIIYGYTDTTLEVEFLGKALTGVKRISYTIENLGEYSVIVMYINT